MRECQKCDSAWKVIKYELSNTSNFEYSDFGTQQHTRTMNSTNECNFWNNGWPPRKDSCINTIVLPTAHPTQLALISISNQTSQQEKLTSETGNSMRFPEQLSARHWGNLRVDPPPLFVSFFMGWEGRGSTLINTTLPNKNMKSKQHDIWKGRKETLALSLRWHEKFTRPVLGNVQSETPLLGRDTKVHFATHFGFWRRTIWTPLLERETKPHCVRLGKCGVHNGDGMGHWYKTWAGDHCTTEFALWLKPGCKSYEKYVFLDVLLSASIANHVFVAKRKRQSTVRWNSHCGVGQSENRSATFSTVRSN